MTLASSAVYQKASEFVKSYYSTGNIPDDLPGFLSQSGENTKAFLICFAALYSGPIHVQIFDFMNSLGEFIARLLNFCHGSTEDIAENSPESGGINKADQLLDLYIGEGSLEIVPFLMTSKENSRTFLACFAGKFSNHGSLELLPLVEALSIFLTDIVNFARKS